MPIPQGKVALRKKITRAELVGLDDNITEEVWATFVWEEGKDYVTVWDEERDAEAGRVSLAEMLRRLKEMFG